MHGGVTMNEELERMEKHINECFAHIKPTISLRELYEYKTHIMNEEVVIPCLRGDISFQLEMLRQRVEALTDLIEAEERRMWGEYKRRGIKQ